jgi:hypothetical protein
LSFENSSFTIRMVYFSDSRMASTFPSHTVRSSVCKSFTALSWSPLYHVVHNHHEPLEQGVYRLTGKMSEILVLSLISRIQPCLNIRIPNMSILQLQPNLVCQILYLNPMEFRLTQRTVQVVDCLVGTNMSLDPGARKLIG